MIDWDIQFSHLNNSNLMLIYVLIMAVFFTLIKVRKRLAGQPMRFAGVMFGHLFLLALISAWTWGLAIPSKGQTQVAIDSENWLEQHQHGAKLLAYYPTLEKLSISGYGFTKGHWQDLTGVAVEFNSKHVVAGFADVSWRQQLHVGEYFNVKGQWLNPPVPLQVVNVHLVDVAGVKVASARVRHGERFELKGTVKATGNFAFKLQAIDDDGQQIDMQSLFVDVKGLVANNKQGMTSVKLLVMQSSPSFEVNQLKNWLGNFKAQMVIFTDISKERFITQSINRDKQDIPQSLSPQLLASMDMLIMDGRKLAGLNYSHAQMVANAVEQGLGLMIFADSDFIENTPKWLQEFNFNAVAGNARNAKVLPVVNEVQSEVGFSVIPYVFNLNNPSHALQVLERDHQNRPLTLLKNHGLGKVAISLLTTRYQWHQQQKLDMYSSAWQHIFKGVSRVERSARFVSLPNVQNIQLVDEKISICLLSNNKQVINDGLTLNANGHTIKLPLTQDTSQNSRYCSWYWPSQSGWHLFSFANDEVKVKHWRYVYDRQSWLTHQQNIRLQDTHQFIAENEGKKRQTRSHYKNISSSWYWWLLIVCFTLLWLEGRSGKHKAAQSA